MECSRFKFRAWYKNPDGKYEMIYDVQASYDNLGGGTGSVYHFNFQDVINDEDAIIEQCTGLKDKNGNLIYEGDVVVVPNQYPYFDYADDVPHKSLNDTFGVIEHDAVPNYVGIVEWDEESVQFVIVLQCVNPSKSGISNGCCHSFDEDENLEVIGNIHEMGV